MLSFIVRKKWFSMRLSKPSVPLNWCPNFFGIVLILFFLAGICNPVLAQSPKTSLDPVSSSNSLVDLGRKLFFDTSLSQDQTISCSSCHKPEQGFTDGKVVAEGVQGKKGTRNVPSLLNASLTVTKFWDGRKPSLLEQVLEPLINPNEHGLQNLAQLLQKIQSNQDYSVAFQNAFDRKLKEANAKDIAQALSAYVLSLKPKTNRLTDFLLNNQVSNLNEAEQHGLELFRGQAGCAACHKLDGLVTLTDGDYHARGIGLRQLTGQLALLIETISKMPPEARESAISINPDISALGRFVVTLNPSDIGKFKTPSLYQVALTAPYMHDGSISTLEAAVDWELYYRGQNQKQSIVLSQYERNSLIAFLRALTIPSQNKSL